MNTLKARDAIDSRIVHIDSDKKVKEIIRKVPAGSVFAVFEQGRYQGIVTEREAALFPGRIFADVLPRQEIAPVTSEDYLDVVFCNLHHAQGVVIPVCDQGDQFAGIISEASLFAALLERERTLRQKKDTYIDSLERDMKDQRVAASVFSDTTKAILVLNKGAIIVSANPAFYRSTGLCSSDCIGIRIGRLPNPVFSAALHPTGFFVSLRRALRHEGTWSGQVWCRQADGEFHARWLHVNCIRNSQGDVSHWIAILSEIDREKQVERNLQKMAYYDALTGLPNRQLFLDRIDDAVSHSQQKSTSFALLFVDLDRFKDVNDSLGHAFGDQLLQLAADRLKLAVRSGDTVARLGGDEFTIIVHDVTSDSAAVATASRIIEHLQAPFLLRGQRIFVTASIGIAQFPADGCDSDTLMKNADTAMYHSKEDGRNRFSVFHAELSREISERLFLENELRSSLEQQGAGLSIHWQPIIDFSNGEYKGFEALTRWQHPHLGAISPARFIHVAETYGLMGPLGSWLFKAAAVDIRRFRSDSSKQSLTFSLNVSAGQIYDDLNLCDEITVFLQESGLPAEQCIVEITESTLVRKDRSAERTLSKLKEQGVKIAIDDFGTGYSNLAYLKKFSVDYLKVDQSFVRDVVSDNTAQQNAARQIVGAIIQMAHGLGIATTAEGIETQQQREIILQLRSDYGQGYLFGRPMTLENYMP